MKIFSFGTEYGKSQKWYYIQNEFTAVLQLALNLLELSIDLIERKKRANNNKIKSQKLYVTTQSMKSSTEFDRFISKQFTNKFQVQKSFVQI